MFFRILSVMALSAAVSLAGEASRYDYQVLATSKTSTMEKEMNQAAEAGYSFRSVMGGETGFGGNEVVVVMAKDPDAERARKEYRLLATSKTSTMQKEIQEAGDRGFRYVGQTVFESAFRGKEVSVILERDNAQTGVRYVYKLLATTKTSTMQKELQEAGAEGFDLLGMTVGKTAFGGSELVCFLGKALKQ